jgi:hypothetical protein
MRKFAERLFGGAGEDRREHPRFPGGAARAAARVLLGETEYEMRDFSLSGFSLKGYDGGLIEGESFTFTFILPDDSAVPCVGTVSRIADGTLAARYIRPVPEMVSQLEAHLPDAA